MTKFSLWRVGVAGGVGGGVNATLCYLSLPVPVQDPAVHLQWHVIPAGCAHGALLALVGVVAFQLAERLSPAAQWFGAVCVAWFGGYLAWIPLDLSVSARSVVESLGWPVLGQARLSETLWIPFGYFGIVAGLLYASLLLARRSDWRWARLAGAVAAGTLGSLWWWIEWGPWYFSILHGSIWGCLVGLASL